MPHRNRSLSPGKPWGTCRLLPIEGIDLSRSARVQGCVIAIEARRNWHRMRSKLAGEIRDNVKPRIFVPSFLLRDGEFRGAAPARPRGAASLWIHGGFMGDSWGGTAPQSSSPASLEPGHRGSPE